MGEFLKTIVFGDFQRSQTKDAGNIPAKRGGMPPSCVFWLNFTSYN